MNSYAFFALHTRQLPVQFPSFLVMSDSSMLAQASQFLTLRPEIQPGFTIRVHQKVQEGDKERIQVYEGLVIGVHSGHTPTDRSITVRRIASGVGVEKIFPVHSPSIVKIEVKKVAKVRRAKLNFLRGRRGKSARISERFTNSDEFAIASAPAVDAQPATEAAEQTSAPEQTQA